MEDNGERQIDGKDLEVKFKAVERALNSEPRQSVTTTDRKVFEKAKSLLEEQGLKAVDIKVTPNNFDPDQTIDQAVARGLGEQQSAELRERFGDSWVSEVLDYPDEAQVDLGNIVFCIEVDSAVQPEDTNYSDFANYTRSIAQNTPIATVLYAPQNDQIHTEFRVRSRYIE